MRQSLFLALGFAITLALPGIASASDVGCVWRELPATARTAALAAYANSQDNFFSGLDPVLMGQAMTDCVALPKSERGSIKVAETIGVALTAYIIQQGSEAFLVKELRLDPAALERAYGQLNPKQRQDLLTSVEKSKTPSRETYQALFAAIRVAYPSVDLEKFIEQPAFLQFVAHFGARALRERTEAKF